jgi:gamma-glutamylcyclotransferase (GGCT)/AIG2-like uncharacterized protein YtfP
MLIYNVTVNVEENIHLSWVEWMKTTHIPEVLATGKFIEATMTRVLFKEEMGGVTYSVQYKVKDRATLELYYREDADRLRNETVKQFGNAFVAFRTELEVITIEKATVGSATEYLFSYGTLQDMEVQKLVFSRILKGEEDQLNYHRISEEMVGGLYPTIRLSKNPSEVVKGYVYVISQEELKRVDAYEGDAYARKKVTLASGINAWVYHGKKVLKKKK